jgi:glycerol dehydrogenase-like iron-containing ADH family enzyme
VDGDSARGLVDRLQRANLVGPVLVVADNDAIACGAIAWAADFAAAGWLHRVRFWEGAATPAAIAKIAAEAAQMRAAVIVAVGASDTVAAARAVAEAACLPSIAATEPPGD